MTICHWLWLLFFLWYKKRNLGDLKDFVCKRKCSEHLSGTDGEIKANFAFHHILGIHSLLLFHDFARIIPYYLPFHFVKCLSISLLSKTLLGTFLLKSSFPITCSLSLLPCPRFKVTFLACLSSFRGPPHTAETVGAYKLQWQRRLPSQVTEKQDKLVWTRIIWSFQGHPTWPYLAPPNMPYIHIWAHQI